MSNHTSYLAVMNMTKRMAKYMGARFKYLTCKAFPPPTYPEDWGLELIIDLNLAAQVIAVAYKNEVKTSWDAEDYARELTSRCNGQNEKIEAKLEEKFPPVYEPRQKISDPMLVSDKEGRALVWYMPGLLSRRRKESMWGNLQQLNDVLKFKSNTTNWRTSSKLYNQADMVEVRPGTISMAPAWFEQGHDTERWPLRISGALIDPDGPASQWVESMAESSAILGAVLSVIHPDLYEAGINAMQLLQDRPTLTDTHHRLLEILEVWSSPFHGLSVISNRVTPAHRDVNSAKAWLDMLVALGTYRAGRLELPGLGIYLDYDAGTVVGIAGRIIVHAAECDGDRACIAYYMREKVHKRLLLPDVGWFCPAELY